MSLLSSHAEPNPADAAPLAVWLPRLAEGLRARGVRLATAESCTGGLIAARCTDLAGSSDWFECGIVSYSNQAKVDCLGVPDALLAAHGAVSAEVAQAMATGLLARAPVSITAAVTGIAGPGGASADKPVGLVWLAWAWHDRDGTERVEVSRAVFDGDRAAVRQATVACALHGVWMRLDRIAPAQRLAPDAASAHRHPAPPLWLPPQPPPHAGNAPRR